MAVRMSMRQHETITAYVALGANLGDRAGNIGRAIELLRLTPQVSVEKVSSLLDNPAVGGPEGSPPFLNGVVEIRTTLTAHQLLARLQQIETELGRVRKEHWEPRPIDLDLLLYGQHILSSRDLVVPHPLMHERRFVLEPLAEIAPGLIHPILQMSITGLLRALDNTESSVL
jgi:2-amino-4-hydroxy-6-hydroxymethyldihydropteridine diphosphokinase